MAHLSPPVPPRLVAVTDDFAVIDKPAHLLVHPTRPDGQYSLLEWLKEQYPGRDVSLVNRLDRETTGLVLAALHTEAASILGRMTMRREIDKEYLAIVHGCPEPAQGLIDAPLGRKGLGEDNPVHLKQAILEDGAAAQTKYRIIASGGGFSVLSLKTLTGRLHQIRVHLAHIGHPVVGDKIYGPDSRLYLRFIEEGWTAEHQQALFIDHHALHAHKLSFEWNGVAVKWDCPLPEEVAVFVRGNIPGAESLLLR